MVLRFGLALLVASAAIATVETGRAYAQVVISDTFDDGDRNNDGENDAGETIDPSTIDGIAWYGLSARDPDANPRPLPGIIDDSGATGLDSGNALGVDNVRGNNGTVLQGVFGQTISLGETVGSRLRLSFDFRVDDSIEPFPTATDFRFGIYADVDDEFTTSTTGWGSSDGDFLNRGNNDPPPPAIGDLGAFVRLEIGTDAMLDGSDTRIFEELDTANILNGQQGDAQGQATADADDNFNIVRDNLENQVVFELERTAPNSVGETVEYTFSLTTSGGTTTTISGRSNSDTGVAGGDSFDYFLARPGEDVDWVLDNFAIELIDFVPPSGDFNGDENVDAQDYVLFRDGVEGADYDSFAANFGTTSGQVAAAAAPVPEPSSVAMLLFAAGGVCRGRRG